MILSSNNGENLRPRQSTSWNLWWITQKWENALFYRVTHGGRVNETKISSDLQVFGGVEWTNRSQRGKWYWTWELFCRSLIMLTMRRGILLALWKIKKYTWLEQWQTLWRKCSDFEWKTGFWIYLFVLLLSVCWLYVCSKLFSNYPDKELLFSSGCYESFLPDFPLWRGRGL